MKSLLKYILLLVFNLIIAQNNNEIKLLKNFKSYLSIKYPKSKTLKWTYKYKLVNGLIAFQENYHKNELVYQSKFIYDSIKNVRFEIKLYDRNDNYKIDTVSKEESIYNEKKDLVQILFFGKSYKRFSNFNDDGYPQLEFKDFINDKIEYKYDSKNNIIESKIYSKYFDNKTLKETDTIQIETISYKYDIHNNIIELNRNFKIPVTFPIAIGGGRDCYENEKYRYVYNKYGLWIKKYWIVNGKEYFIEKRKFYK